MTQEEVIGLLEPTVKALGYELIDIDLKLGGSDGLLRLYINSDQGISLEDCSVVSEQVSALLDVENPIPGQYKLEVSSPGADRVLRTEQHLQQFAGQRVKIQTHVVIHGRKRFAGELKGMRDELVIVDIDGNEIEIPFGKIKRVRLAPLFDRLD